ncbi:hypothetical protein CC86DRAFT_377435 [Ophiobolus disseminans]|uniref:Zn(2)-C6 fungal-type domain-containing protein n=1 Tax=Ophiobolus disseminans TaxID=1469910 RepID=A0A6A7AI19_9PLEO|nr:hypothetical protein CC86DRAFT_377435 [Ophiobolus disseminans]
MQEQSHAQDADGFFDYEGYEMDLDEDEQDEQQKKASNESINRLREKVHEERGNYCKTCVSEHKTCNKKKPKCSHCNLAGTHCTYLSDIRPREKSPSQAHEPPAGSGGSSQEGQSGGYGYGSGPGYSPAQFGGIGYVQQNNLSGGQNIGGAGQNQMQLAQASPVHTILKRKLDLKLDTSEKTLANQLNLAKYQKLPQVYVK